AARGSRRRPAPAGRGRAATPSPAPWRAGRRGSLRSRWPCGPPERVNLADAKGFWFQGGPASRGMWTELRRMSRTREDCRWRWELRQGSRRCGSVSAWRRSGDVVAAPAERRKLGEQAADARLRVIVQHVELGVDRAVEGLAEERQGAPQAVDQREGGEARELGHDGDDALVAV